MVDQSTSIPVETASPDEPERAFRETLRLSRGSKFLLWSLCLAPLLLFAASAVYQREVALRDAEISVGRTIQVLEEHALRVFEAQQLIIAQVDQFLGGMTWEEIRASEEVHDFLSATAAGSPHVDGLWLVPPDGRTANSADFFPFPDVNVADRRYFQALRERDELHFGEMIVGRTKGNLNFNISRRRSPRDRFEGVILVTSSLDYFIDFWEQAATGEFVAGIFRQDGEILVRYPLVESLQQRLDASSPLFVQMQDRNDEVYRSRSTIDGKGRIYGYSRIGGTPLFIGYGFTYAKALESWRAEILPMALIALLASALLAVAMAAIMRQTQRLETSAASWRRTAQELSREVGRRVAAEDVAAERQRLLEEVGALTAQRQSILENMAEGVIALDEEGRIIYANPEAWKLLGPFEEGEQRVSSLLDRRRLLAADGTDLDPEDAPDRLPLSGEDLGETEFLVRTADGNHAACNFRGGSIIGPGGRVTGAVLTFWDISERKREAERRDLLMRELDHRVRNMLAKIMAMIRTSDEPARSKKEFVATLRGRVEAMARTYGVLSAGRWEGATMGRLVDEEIGQAADSRQLDLDGDREEMIPPKQAADLALTLHELSTNAIKYGAWSVPEGRVRLTWARESAENGCGLLRVEWKETGGPPVAEAPSRQGFGTRLILNLFPDDESVNLTYQPDGLRCILRVPLAEENGMRSAAEQEPSHFLQRDTVSSLAGIRVLVVEDEAIVRLDLVSMLREAGANVVGEAGSLGEGMEWAETQQADVAVLDRNLNGESCLPLARLLERRGAGIVFVSGYRAMGHRELLAEDEHIHLQKPITQDELVDAVGAMAAAVLARRNRSFPQADRR